MNINSIKDLNRSYVAFDNTSSRENYTLKYIL